MKLIELKCPACGAEMKVNPDLDRVICIYCGKEMLVDNGKTELVIANGFDYGYEQEMGRLKAQEDFRLEQQRLEEEELLDEGAMEEWECSSVDEMRKSYAKYLRSLASY